MICNRPSDFVPDEKLQKRIESGEAEEWEIPFVCDACGVFQSGGNMSNKSDNTRLVCGGCFWVEEGLKKEVIIGVNEIVNGAESIKG